MSDRLDEIKKRYTAVEPHPAYDGFSDSEKSVLLKVDHQSFRIDYVADTDHEAEWMRDELAKALYVLIQRYANRRNTMSDGLDDLKRYRAEVHQHSPWSILAVMVESENGNYVLFADAKALLDAKEAEIAKWVKIAGENQRSANLSAEKVRELEDADRMRNIRHLSRLLDEAETEIASLTRQLEEAQAALELLRKAYENDASLLTDELQNAIEQAVGKEGGMTPGSDEAVAHGCTCPRMDNGWGKAVRWVIREGCPIHDSQNEDNAPCVSGEEER